MITVTVIQDAIQFTGEGIGVTLNCGLYTAVSHGTVYVKVVEIANPKVVVVNPVRFDDYSGAFTATSQSDCVAKLGKLLAQNLTIGKILVDVNDTTLGYLNYKIQAGTGITLTIENVNGNEYLLISGGGTGVTIVYWEFQGSGTDTYTNAALIGKSVFQVSIDGNIIDMDTFIWTIGTGVLKLGVSTSGTVKVLLQ